MRVTELTKHNAVKKNLNTNADELQNLMISMSNGRMLNKPSDDPVGAAKAQDFRTSINHSKTLEKNISADKVWLNANEQTIKQIIDMLSRVKDIAMEGANGTSTRENRSTLANEMKLITKSMLDLGNKKEGKLYLFSGTKTFTRPLKMNDKLKDPEVRFYGTRIKSGEKTIPLLQDKPIKGLRAGLFTIFLNETPEYEEINTVDSEKRAEESPPVPEAELRPEEKDAVVEGKPVQKLVIVLNGTESLKEVVKKINEAAIAEQDYVEDPHYQNGFKSKIYSEIGVDNSTYIDPIKGINVTFGEDTTGFFERMNFSNMEGMSMNQARESDDADAQQPIIASIDAEKYKATFCGFSKDKYLIKVIKGGTYGVAQCVISDDEGKTWSQPKLLQQKNEIVNPDGKASNMVQLIFNAKGKPFFREGLEFQFDGNEFVEYRGNDQIKEVLIDNGIKVALNITARQLFNRDPDNSDTVNVFEVLNRLSESLDLDDQTAVIKSIGDVDKSIDQILARRGQIGSTFVELETSEERIANGVDFRRNELSKLEDVDLAKGAVDLNKAELKNRVALDASARLIQPTLINFLK